jgi:hypothetical protein
VNPFATADDLGEEGFVDSQEVRIHYVTMGTRVSGFLVLLAASDAGSCQTL